MIDFSLTDAQREVQRTARAFAEREILPRIRELDANVTYDRSLYEKMGAEGFLGLPIPERYGGAGMDYIAFALLCEEIGKHQLVKQMLANMYAGIEAGRLLVWKAGARKNAGERNTRETSLAKWFTTDHAVASALDAIQIHGAYGYSNEYPVERYLRNAKGSVIYEGTSQIHTLMQADYLLGYRRDRELRHPQPPFEGEM
jgi:alkylation response protein AidB-like acyl-CoA dehydrogenase